MSVQRLFSVKIGWFIVGLIVVWRSLITLTSLLSMSQFSFDPTFPYARELLPEFGSRLLTTWAHFDGVHYLTIIDKGYEGTGLIQAFFPLYPLLIRVLSLNGLLNPIVVAVVFSTLCLGVALWVLDKLLRLDGESEKTSRRTMVFMLAFVTAFFFSSMYTESLFLLLSVSSLYLARKKNWWAAGLLGALATLTRLPGVFLIVALLWEYWQEHKKLHWQMSACLLPLAGLLVYMGYLWQVFGDPLLFMNVQSQFGAERETTRLILLYQVFFRYAKMLVTVPVQSLTYYQVVLELGSAIFGVIGLIAAFFWVRRSYVYYAALAFLLPTLTGTFSSLPRYILVLFPLFVVTAKIKWPLVRWGLLLLFFGLQLVNVVLFTMGRWVA